MRHRIVSSLQDRCGHTLVLFITRNNRVVHILPINQTLLSDHSFVVDDVMHLPQRYHHTGTWLPPIRNWRAIDINAFADDLQHSELVISPPDDVADAFVCYDQTLTTLLDQHAPLRLRRVRT